MLHTGPLIGANFLISFYLFRKKKSPFSSLLPSGICFILFDALHVSWRASTSEGWKNKKTKPSGPEVRGSAAATVEENAAQANSAVFSAIKVRDCNLSQKMSCAGCCVAAHAAPAPAQELRLFSGLIALRWKCSDNPTSYRPVAYLSLIGRHAVPGLRPYCVFRWHLTALTDIFPHSHSQDLPCQTAIETLSASPSPLCLWERVMTAV